MSFEIQFTVLCPDSVTSFVIRGQRCSSPLVKALGIKVNGIKGSGRFAVL